MLKTHIVPSTDAVFRYLLVRYGFHPTQASGLKEPLKVGDVMYVGRVLVIIAHLLMLNKNSIMPVHSFRADASEGFQGAHKVVWHGSVISE